MHQEELQRLVETLSRQWFRLPFKHQACFNSRLRTTGGRYMLGSHDIELNPKQLDYYGHEALVDIIKHELCHYHLHLAGRGNRHGDREFKYLLALVGGSRHCQTIPGTENQSRVFHLYRCQSCGEIYKRKRRMDTNRFLCGVCDGPLEKMSGVKS